MQRFQKKYLIGTSVGAVGLVIILGSVILSQSNYVLGEKVTKEGQIVCLPHKKGIFGGSETLECAIGLYASDGRFYGLENLLEEAKKDPVLLDKISGVPAEEPNVMISGTFASVGPEYERYDIVGVIEVTQIEL